MSSPLTPTSEVLDRAADLIEQRGWVRGEGWYGQWDHDLGEAVRDSKPLCLEGAIMAAAGILYGFEYLGEHDTKSDEGFGLRELHECPAYRAVEEYLGQVPYYWNDNSGDGEPRRQAYEVVDLLREVAMHERINEEEQQ